MNKRQKIIIAKLVIVIVVTFFAAVVLMNLKAVGLRREAMRAMTNLSLEIMNYKKTYIFLPPQEYLDKIIRDMKAQGLLGDVQYRASTAVDSKDDEILAYTKTNYHTMFDKDDCLVLRLNGSVEWMDKFELDALLARQEGPMEKQTRMLGK